MKPQKNTRKFWEWRNRGSRKWHKEGWSCNTAASRKIEEVWIGGKRISREVVKVQFWDNGSRKK